MKNIIITSMICSLMISCMVHKKNTVTYEFPAAMPEAVKADYIKQWQKGKTLYEINCAGCHNTTLNGKTVIPDFTPEKLIGYELRVSNSRHESNMTDEKVTAEELGLIMTFLSYKKKSS